MARFSADEQRRIADAWRPGFVLKEFAARHGRSQHAMSRLLERHGVRPRRVRDEDGRDRFWEKVAIGLPEECWPWTGTTSNGRGQFHLAGRPGVGTMHAAYRIAYEFSVGPIPDGAVVRHKCDNPRCCNPAHLEIGSQADNMRDAIERGRTSRGERHTHCRITEAQVREIRALKGQLLSAEIGQRYGIADSTVRAIHTGHSWSWLDQSEVPKLADGDLTDCVGVA